jgi:hypothetical protein
MIKRFPWGISAGTRSTEVRWTELAKDFYRSKTLAEKIRAHSTNAHLRACIIRDDFFRRLGMLQSFGAGVHLVYLHHVFSDEVVPFRKLLSRLSRQATFISHSEAVRRITSGAIDRTYVSISFDDGLLSCLDAARIMEDFGAQACFFVCPAAVDHFDDYVWISRWCHERLHKSPVKVMSWDDLEGSPATLEKRIPINQSLHPELHSDSTSWLYRKCLSYEQSQKTHSRLLRYNCGGRGAYRGEVAFLCATELSTYCQR